MKTLTLSRRALLKGLGGTAIAMPFLEVMLGRGRGAEAQSITMPRRFLVCFDGQSLGADRDTYDLYVPDNEGAGYDLKAALAPLAMYGNVKDQISVVSGLQIPWANAPGAPIPAGGRAVGFHTHSLSPLLSGARSISDDDYSVAGPTSDQVVADAIGAGTTFHSLVYRVQASWYLGVSAPYGRDLMSYRRPAGGSVTSIPAQVSPRAAFDALFTGFTPPDPHTAAAAGLALRERRSVLDLVDHRTQALMARLGRPDQTRMEQHLDAIRDLERRLAAVPPVVTSSCMQLPDPGADPPIGGDQPGATTGGDATFNVNAGYSNEDARARLFCDMIAMAFTCDLTRAASLMFTMAQSHMNMHALTGQPYDLHELGHSMGTPEMSAGIAWHMKHFGYLVAKLRDTPEGAGSVLDNSAIVMLHEGGHGHDPEGMHEHSSHSTENMACLIAGRAGGLVPGRHVRATGMHPGNVLISAMHAVGVDQNLGEVTGAIPALFAP